ATAADQGSCEHPRATAAILLDRNPWLGACRKTGSLGSPPLNLLDKTSAHLKASLDSAEDSLHIDNLASGANLAMYLFECDSAATNTAVCKAKEVELPSNGVLFTSYCVLHQIHHPLPAD
ncbi:unnamed protein product, partial [Effrenium voratum]